MLEEIKALKGKHKMSLMVLIKAPVLTHWTMCGTFQSDLPKSLLMFLETPPMGQLRASSSGLWLSWRKAKLPAVRSELEFRGQPGAT